LLSSGTFNLTVDMVVSSAFLGSAFFALLLAGAFLGETFLATAFLGAGLGAATLATFLVIVFGTFLAITFLGAAAAATLRAIKGKNISDQIFKNCEVFLSHQFSNKHIQRFLIPPQQY